MNYEMAALIISLILLREVLYNDDIIVTKIRSVSAVQP